MRNAPSVVYPVGRSSFYGMLLVMAGAVALTVMALWTWTPVAADRARPVMAAALVAWGLWCVWAASGWWRSPRGTLEWRAGDAAGAWLWQEAGKAPQRLTCAPEAVLDLQRVLLVRLDDGRWLWLEAGRDGSPHWWDLRRALLASVPA